MRIFCIYRSLVELHSLAEFDEEVTYVGSVLYVTHLVHFVWRIGDVLNQVFMF